MTSVPLSPSVLLEAAHFSAMKHRYQKRKDAEGSPYINHPLAVASILASEGKVADETLLVAALLHDTVEDTDTTFDELKEQFGVAVSRLVGEVTDDKRLPKALRKELQVERAEALSRSAKQLKIADKISNIRDIVASPPADWSEERKTEYLEWATRVVNGCRGVNKSLDDAYDRTIAVARKALGVEA